MEETGEKQLLLWVSIAQIHAGLLFSHLACWGLHWVYLYQKCGHYE